MAFRIALAIMLNISALLPSVALAADYSPVKVGILTSSEGAISVYSESLKKAVTAFVDQTDQNVTLPQIEFVSATLGQDYEENIKVLSELVTQGVTAIVAPNLLSALITAGPDSVEIVPLVAKVDRTADLALIAENAPSSNFKDHPQIIRTIRKLKFLGALTHVVLMYDAADPFGRGGYEAAVTILTAEHVTFSTELFDSQSVDFWRKLSEIKFEAPDVTVIIVAKTADAAEVLFQAHDKLELKGHVVGLVGEGNPTIYDLADSIENESFDGAAWDLNPDATITAAIAEQFSADQFAAEAYFSFWSIALQADDEAPLSRASLRNRLVENGGSHLDKEMYNLATWIVHAFATGWYNLSNSLTIPQIRQLNGLVSPDLQ